MDFDQLVVMPQIVSNQFRKNIVEMLLFQFSIHNAQNQSNI